MALLKITKKHSIYKNRFSHVLHLISLLSSYILTDLYFFSNRSIDFEKYKVYIEIFKGNVEYTNLNQGIFYYFSNFLIMQFKNNNLSSFNYDLFISNTIQTTNFIFYIVGLIGLYRLLRIYEFSKTSILISFSILHFIPKIIEMRVTFKPENIGFSLLPYVLIAFEKFFKEQDIKILLLAMLPLSIILTSKPSISAMVVILITFKFFKKISVSNFKMLLICFIFLLILLFGLTYENYQYNNSILTDKTITNESVYYNSADLGFIKTINKFDFYYFPIIGYHNNSAIGITLLDTFGDYYKVGLSSDNHYFHYYQKNPFQDLRDENNFNYGIFAREYSSLLLALIFFFLIFFTVIKDKNLFPYVASPLFGIFVLLISAFGIVGKNFNPMVGDTLKPFYYSFLISLSFVFILCFLYKINKLFFGLIALIFMLSSFFIYGFPKSNYEIINNNLEDKILISDLCIFESALSDNLNTEDCQNKEKLYCEFNEFSDEARRIFIEDTPDGYIRVFRSDSNGGEVIPIEKVDEFVNEGGYSLEPNMSINRKDILSKNKINLIYEDSLLNVDDYEECLELVGKGYKPNNEISLNTDKIPFINFLTGIISILISFLYIRKIDKSI